MSLTICVAAMMALGAVDAPAVEVIRGNEISPSRPAVAAGSEALNPRAMDLVDSDPAIHSWAIRDYDRNRDGWLTLYEAQPVVRAFEDIADEDRDGRVTVREYRAAVEFLRARY